MLYARNMNEVNSLYLFYIFEPKLTLFDVCRLEASRFSRVRLNGFAVQTNGIHYPNSINRTLPLLYLYDAVGKTSTIHLIYMAHGQSVSHQALILLL